jgi:hypothetical protein
MEWKSVSRDGFQAILDPEIAALPKETLEVLSLHAVNVFEQPCFRDSSYGIEKVFVVARAGTRLLFYDDVEEEFGIGVPDSDGVLQVSELCGPLAAAIRALVGEAT